jgi:CPA1 family monovalent cation:H+ antiporter
VAAGTATAILAFGREQQLQLLVMLVCGAALLILAGPLRIPYPILLVLGGLLLGFGPGVPKVTMPPELVLIGILPPLLYVSAYFTGLRELRQNLGEISLLAVGLVAMTTAGVAVVAHQVTNLPWAESFVLGAVVSPTDPIAATAIGQRLGVPRRLIDVIEGESLLNDGTALVFLRTAIVAAVAGTFSPWGAGLRLVASIVGGIAVGLVVGYVIRIVRRSLDNPPLEVTIAFLTGYFAFLPASVIGASGVLAVVTAGVYIGWHTPELTTVDTRLAGGGFWNVLTFLLNVLLFGLIGLQLRPILDNLAGSGRSLLAEAAAVVLAVIGLRIVWVFAATYVPRALVPRLRARSPSPPWTHTAFIAWNGMRGAVTIAAALVVPLTTVGGGPLVGRDLIIFLAFAVVLATLVGQGLSLPAVIRALRLESDDGGADAEEARARIRAAEAAIARLDELEAESWVLPDTAARTRGLYGFRIDRFSARLDPDGADGKIEKRSLKYQRLRRELLDAERQAVVEMRNTGEISDAVMRKVERDLDLEVSRLDADQ